MRKWLLAGLAVLATARVASAGVETDVRPLAYGELSATTVSISGTATLSSITIPGVAYLITVEVVRASSSFVDGTLAHGLVSLTRTVDGAVLATGYSTLNERVFDILDRAGYGDRGTGYAAYRLEGPRTDQTLFLVNPPLPHLPSGDVAVAVKYRISFARTRVWSGPIATDTQRTGAKATTTRP